MDLAPRICLVSTDRDPGDSPDLRLGELLASAGWEVHVLACEPDSRLVPPCARVTVSHLADVPETPEARLVEWIGAFDRQSLHVLAVLERLHAVKPFDVIQYPEEGALGFRVAQARRTGSGLDGAYLLARLRGPSAWKRTTEARWMSAASDMVRDFGEQTSFELADGRVSQSRYLIDEARKLGWAVPDDTSVVPDCPAAPRLALPLTGPVGEVVFAGPLDKLHGLRVFVRAVKALPAGVPVAFVGPDSKIEGQPASRWVAGKLKGRRVTYHEAAGWPAILEYLRGGNRLAVMPHLTATDVEFARELARNRVPFLVADFGPAAELVADDEAREHVMFPASASGLSRALAAYLAEPVERRREWVERLAAAHNPEAEQATIRGFYARVLAEARARRAAASVPATARALPRVTVGVTHYNLGEFLPATLASVAAQSYPDLEVIVADDGSDDPRSAAVLEEMEREYPHFKFLRGPNVGVCGNRNRCLGAATGELFFPLDADNVAAPDMIARLAEALLRQPEGVGAASCFWLGFTSDAELKAGKFCGAYRPTGGPRLAVGLWNPYGETSGLFPTALLRELGGYEDLHPEYVSEDWHLYVKLAARGLRVAVVPRPLYFYRIRGDSRYRTGDHAVNHLRVLPDVADVPLTHPERVALWNLLAGMFHHAQLAESGSQADPESGELAVRVAALEEHRDALLAQLRSRRYRLADLVGNLFRPVSAARQLAGWASGVKRRVGSRLVRGQASGRR
jgi:GT2 family glycosyltransferase